jgi:hypothetical protein
MVNLPELVGADLLLLLEDRAEVVGVLKAGEQGDFLHLGVAVTSEIWRDRLVKCKEKGCNAICTAHPIFAPGILDLCDEIGLLVYEEPFDKWVRGRCMPPG